MAEKTLCDIILLENKTGVRCAFIRKPVAANEPAVFRMAVVPETKTLWLRVIGGTGWTRIEHSGFLREHPFPGRSEELREKQTRGAQLLRGS